MDGDEAQVRSALEHDPVERHRFGQQPDEGPLASLLPQLTHVVKLGQLGAGEANTVDVEREPLEAAPDERRRPVDQDAEAESPSAGGGTLERGQDGELRLHDRIAYDPAA